MATGDSDDIVSRVRATIPPTWYPSDAPYLDGLLTAFGNAASWVYGLIGYTRLQTRIATATDGWLDLIANDFFGRRMPREGRSDDLYRQAIIAELFRPRQTRLAVIDVLEGLTGRAPIIFEPARPQDTGGYSPGPTGDGKGRALAYNAAGGYGSLLMPYQFLVRAYRSASSGIPNVAGYLGYAGPNAAMPSDFASDPVSGHPVSGFGALDPDDTSPPISFASYPGLGAYSTPSLIQYGSLAMIDGPVTDAAIYSAVDNVRAAGVTAWTNISN